MQGKLRGDNKMLLMGLTPACKVFWGGKKTQQSNMIIAGHMCSEITVVQASVFSTQCKCLKYMVPLKRGLSAESA